MASQGTFSSALNGALLPSMRTKKSSSPSFNRKKCFWVFLGGFLSQYTGAVPCRPLFGQGQNWHLAN